MYLSCLTFVSQYKVIIPVLATRSAEAMRWLVSLVAAFVIVMADLMWWANCQAFECYFKEIIGNQFEPLPISQYTYAPVHVADQ